VAHKEPALEAEVETAVVVAAEAARALIPAEVAEEAAARIAATIVSCSRFSRRAQRWDDAQFRAFLLAPARHY
jgi:uncharacterized protein YaiL (DUF2058 family)